jgi:hypothetical protein
VEVTPATSDIPAPPPRPPSESLERAVRPPPAASAVLFEPPPVEPQYVLDSLSREEIAEEVAQIHKALEDRDAIKRLNAGRVTNDERAEFGAMIYRAAFLKGELSKRDLKALEERVAEYEKGHAARVAAYLHPKE